MRRIIITQHDLAQQSVTRIAGMLRKLWPEKKLGLMQAQERTAVIFGYRSTHELQSLAVQSLPTELSTSRDAIKKSLVWAMYRKFNIDLLSAGEIADKLPLKQLDIDRLTQEYKLETATNPPPRYIVDEFSAYISNGFEPENPSLIAAGAPPCKLAIDPSGKAFRWSRLLEMVRQLPEDYLDDLMAEAKSTGQTQEQVRNAFIAQLVQESYESAAEAIKRAMHRPLGCSIQWLFDRDMNVLGRVIYIQTLRGIVPYLYDPYNDDIYHAMADLAVGKPIAAPAKQITQTHQQLYILNGYLTSLMHGENIIKDLIDYLRNSLPLSVRYAAERPDGMPALPDIPNASSGIDLSIEQIKQLYAQYQPYAETPYLTPIEHLTMKRGALAGAEFDEQGQTYIRAMFIRPSTNRNPVAQDWVNNPAYAKTRETIPADAISANTQAIDKINQQNVDAQAYINQAANRIALVEHIPTLFTPEKLNSEIMAIVLRELPLHHDDADPDAEQDEYLKSERHTQMYDLSVLGRDYKKHAHQEGVDLTPYDDHTIGYIGLRAEGGYLNSRYGIPRGRPEKLNAMLFALLSISTSFNSGKDDTDHVNEYVDHLPVAWLAYRNGEIEIQQMNQYATALQNISTALEAEKNAIKDIRAWQEEAKAKRAQNSMGFAYVSGTVPAKYSNPYMEIASAARSKGFMPAIASNTDA